MKRDDELSSGVSGSKIRKYSSLIPYLISEKITDVILLGGFRSNHVIGCVQLLRESGMRPHCFFEDSFNSVSEPGNRLLSRLLLEMSDITLYKRHEKDNLENLIQQKKSTLESSEKKCFVLPEGADCEQSSVGAATLAMDIERNEVEENHFFKNIFLDAGTGLTAHSVIANIKRREERTFHLAICAGDFLQTKSRFSSFKNIHFYDETKRFGDPAKGQLDLIKQIARTQGILIDPVYGVKLWGILSEFKVTDEKVLIVHSGGAFSLHGYSERF